MVDVLDVANLGRGGESLAGVTAKVQKKLTPREITLTVEYTDLAGAAQTRVLISRVPDGDEVTEIGRRVVRFAGVPVDNLAWDDRNRLRALARVSVQVRELTDDQMNALMTELSTDFELLMSINGGLVEHERSFRSGGDAPSQGAPKPRRMVVSGIPAPGGVPGAK
jgi:hypothetical protein